MVIVYVDSLGEFVKALEYLANPRSHVVISDGISTVELVPRVASRNRHLIRYIATEQDVSRAVEEATRRGYRIVRGRIQVTSSA